MSGEDPGPGLQMSSPCILTWQKEGEFSGAPFIRALIPFMRAPPSKPNYVPKVPPPNTITQGLGSQHINVRGILVYNTVEGKTVCFL